jgi:hypothetical protein
MTFFSLSFLLISGFICLGAKNPGIVSDTARPPDEKSRYFPG